VTDPTHPLFGRRFPLIATSTTLTGPGYAWVVYRDDVQLRLPLAATDLIPGDDTGLLYPRPGRSRQSLVAAELAWRWEQAPRDVRRAEADLAARAASAPPFVLSAPLRAALADLGPHLPAR
jgi:hypothetical protein